MGSPTGWSKLKQKIVSLKTQASQIEMEREKKIV